VSSSKVLDRANHECTPSMTHDSSGRSVSDSSLRIPTLSPATSQSYVHSLIYIIKAETRTKFLPCSFGKTKPDQVGSWIIEIIQNIIQSKRSHSYLELLAIQGYAQHSIKQLTDFGLCNAQACVMFESVHSCFLRHVNPLY
jgi:hypothetical protein